ncbi:MAG: thiamine phosphate synthase [Marinifilaceae bacterium]|jgi:thiamine-phosphate pyrophosphorylase|nr:thiamine phosphate synthase [Marinifilaceae bacterium]
MKKPYLQYISQDNKNISHSMQAKLVFERGIEWVQIRMKNKSESDICIELEKAMKYAQQYDGKIIINDNVKLAKQFKTHGLHLGMKDTPVDKARQILSQDIIIGGTANNLDDVKLQIERGADYIGLGPYRYTKTKKNLSPIIQPSQYNEIVDYMNFNNYEVPLIAVGGINYDDITQIINIGLSGAAISGYILKKIENTLKTKIS